MNLLNEYGQMMMKVNYTLVVMTITLACWIVYLKGKQRIRDELMYVDEHLSSDD